VKAAICSLNNHPLDFENNLHNIMKSIEQAKEQKCRLRVGA
jgi:predicted amidohydrolase